MVVKCEADLCDWRNSTRPTTGHARTIARIFYQDFSNLALRQVLVVEDVMRTDA